MGVIFPYHRKKKGLEGLVSKEKLKELNLPSLTRHQPGAGTGVGRADEESLVPRVFPQHQELPSRALQTGVGGSEAR